MSLASATRSTRLAPLNNEAMPPGIWNDTTLGAPRHFRLVNSDWANLDAGPTHSY